MSKHTKTPWKIDGLKIREDDKEHMQVIVADCDSHIHTDMCAANAAYIVRAVNSFDDLLAALKDICDYPQLGKVANHGSNRVKNYTFTPAQLECARAAIDKAEA